MLETLDYQNHWAENSQPYAPTENLEIIPVPELWRELAEDMLKSPSIKIFLRDEEITLEKIIANPSCPSGYCISCRD